MLIRVILIEHVNLSIFIFWYDKKFFVSSPCLEIILDHIYSLEVVGVQGLLTSQPLWNRNADAKFGLFYLSVAFLFIWNLQLNSELLFRLEINLYF